MLVGVITRAWSPVCPNCLSCAHVGTWADSKAVSIIQLLLLAAVGAARCSGLLSSGQVCTAVFKKLRFVKWWFMCICSHKDIYRWIQKAVFRFNSRKQIRSSDLWNTIELHAEKRKSPPWLSCPSVLIWQLW